MTRTNDLKAMILAAGFGTRLLPFTKQIPKPLFPIAGRSILDRMICSLCHAGCESIIINTHHLHEEIDAFIAAQNYEIPVHTRYEPVILGTGGAMRNVADFWDDQPFMVINSDIVTNIDLRKVYAFHLGHDHPVTLVLHDDPEFNKVCVDTDGFIISFRDPDSVTSPASGRLSFTGIQVLDPKVLCFIPGGVFSSSIEAYERLMAERGKIKAFVSGEYHWKDVGSPERYKDAVVQELAPQAFGMNGECAETNLEPEFACTQIKGDGSDRKWYRLRTRNQSLIMADHGIWTQAETSEADAFVRIGRHLHEKGIFVPEIYAYDAFSGLVFVEDLGDVSLQDVVQNAKHANEVMSCYKSVIDMLVRMSVSGAEGFDLSWTYQTPAYDKALILEKECRYFSDAFLSGYVGMDVCAEDFEDEFACLADNALEFSVNGFMHRDMQSRNIMVRHGKYYFIDFQGGRMGPIQYDLASLLIDPYVSLPASLQTHLLDYCVKTLSSVIQVDPDQFRTSFEYCSITRNLQILGAFGYLSRVKGKTYFETYIPTALNTLRHHLEGFDKKAFPRLKAVVNNSIQVLDKAVFVD